MRKILLMLLVITLLLSTVFHIENNGLNKTSSPTDETVNRSLNYDYMKSIWISQYDMLPVYIKNGKQRSRVDYISLVTKIVNNVKELGFNTVFIQLRPNGDSIYPSKLFPASRYAVGDYSSSFSYDPFEILLSIARAKELSVHGWINPLRCMTEKELELISGDYQLTRWAKNKGSDYIVLVDGRYYFNPAHNEVIDLICDGVEEILINYELDGIHIDDYFYPTTNESFDRQSYELYNTNALELADFRRSNVNKLIKSIYNRVKSHNKSVLFGVSPSGNTSRNYNELYADVAYWCKQGGYLDYICPQIYFGFKHETHSFDKLCEEFSEMVKNSDVKLIIGMTLGKAASASDGTIDQFAGVGAYEWIESKNVLLLSLEHIKSLTNCDGVAFFSYQYFFDPVTNEANEKTKEERNNLLPTFKSLE